MPIIVSSPKLERKQSTEKSKVKYCMFLILGLSKFKTIASTTTFGALSFQNVATSSFSTLKVTSSPSKRSGLCSFFHSNIQSYRMALSQDGTSLENKSTSIHEKTKAKYISSSDQSLKEAGERIRAGHLVSFPTETVYGLGCHALDPMAVSRVFDAKERPLTDPLIVHVNHVQDATKLWEASCCGSSTSKSNNDNIMFTNNAHLEKRALEVLADAFWPGPLTIVAKASPEIPSIIMANTGFVACRSPSHPIARRLIAASGVPIAAPSANKFGHVSPTRAAHVMDDLGMEDVWIVNPDLDQGFEESSSGNGIVCDVGVESTVAKVEILSEGMGRVSILRHGAVSAMEILECLVDKGLGGYFEVVEKMQATGESVSHVAPGQTIRHYSPNVESFLISHERYANKSNIWSDEEMKYLETAVIIDFAGRLSSLREMALAYRDLSSDGDSSKAAANVFDALRWSETVDGVKRVYYPEIVVDENKVGKNEALVLAIKDKLTRAASGVVIDILR